MANRRAMARIGALTLTLALLALPAVAGDVAPFAADAAGAPQAPWVHVGLPGVPKSPTHFNVVEMQGRPVLRIDADDAYGNLLQKLPKLQDDRYLSWRWRVDVPNLKADLSMRATDDRAVQVCVMFDMPMDAVPFVERQLLRLASARAGETLPTATLCYVWDSKLMAGSVLDSAFTRRLRMIVLRGPKAPLHTWFSERRDLRTDFLHVFGDEATQMPPIIAVAVGGDSDNTHVRSLAYVADLELAR